MCQVIDITSLWIISHIKKSTSELSITSTPSITAVTFLCIPYRDVIRRPDIVSFRASLWSEKEFFSYRVANRENIFRRKFSFADYLGFFSAILERVRILGAGIVTLSFLCHDLDSMQYFSSVSPAFITQIFCRIWSISINRWIIRYSFFYDTIFLNITFNQLLHIHKCINIYWIFYYIIIFHIYLLYCNISCFI